MAKTAKTGIFLDTTLPLNDSSQVSPVSSKVLDKSYVCLRRKCPTRNSMIGSPERVKFKEVPYRKLGRLIAVFGSYMSGKIPVLAVLAIFGSKVHCMWWHLYAFCAVFWLFSSKPLMFLVNFCYLNYVYGLGMINEELSFNKKFGAIKLG